MNTPRAVFFFIPKRGDTMPLTEKEQRFLRQIQTVKNPTPAQQQTLNAIQEKQAKEERFIRQYNEIKQSGGKTSAAQDSTYKLLTGSTYKPPAPSTPKPVTTKPTVAPKPAKPTVNPYLQSEIDKANRFMRQYAQLKAPTSAQQSTYQRLLSTYGNAIKDGRITITDLDPKAERAYRAANPYAEYTKEKELRFLRQIDEMLKNNQGVSDAQLAQFNQLAQKWNYTPSYNQPPELTEIQPFTPPEYDVLSYDEAVKRAQQQLDPIYQRALENIKAQKYQNELDADQIAAARGLSHSGLAADQLTKIAIAAQGQMASAEAEKAAKIAELAQAMVERDEDRAFRERQQAFQEYLGQANLNMDRDQMLYDRYVDDRNFDYQKQRDKRRDAEWESEQKWQRAMAEKQFNYQQQRDKRRDAEWESEQKWQRAMAEKQFNYQQQRDKVADDRWAKEFAYQQYLDKLKDQRAQEALAWEKQQFATEQAWREYVYNHMSAAERAQLEWNKQQFGEEMAWRIEEANRADKLARDRMEFEAGKKGLKSEGSDGKYDNFWKTRRDAAKAPGFKQFNSILMTAIEKAGVPDSWAPYIMELVGRESSWNPNAKNPKSTAYGYGQFLKSTRQQYEKKYGIKYNTPLNQLILTIHYVKDRYGNPVNALKFWDEHNWY
jgi:hypothetical protein